MVSPAGPEVCHDAVAGASDAAASDGALRSLVTAVIPIGPQLSFIWPTPTLDVDQEVVVSARELERAPSKVLLHSQGAGTLRPDRPVWWLVQTLNALVYVAWESVRVGDLARRDATDFVLETLLGGVGARSALRANGVVGSALVATSARVS